MRLAYVTTYDSRDVTQWSGTGFYMAQALEDQGIEVARIGPLQTYLDPILLAQYAYYRARGLKFQRQRSIKVLRSYARQIEKRIEDLAPDVLFSPGSLPLAYVRSKIPVVFWTDTTFAGVVDAYPALSGLSPATRRDAERAEQTALSGCRLAIYSSEWARQGALENYEVDPAKVVTVPFGTNLKSVPSATEVAAQVARRQAGPLHLLFVGVEWERKGGDYLIALADALVARGLSLELTIVGCRPPPGFERPYVTAAGFLSKNVPEELRKIEELYAQAHFLVLPSRAECTAMVVAEANSFGVPTLASSVGGSPSLVIGGRNGFCFPLRTFVENAAREILRLREDPAAYADLAMNSFAEAGDRLNWKVVGKRVKNLLETVAKESTSSAGSHGAR